MNRYNFFISRKSICQLAMNYPIPHCRRNKTVRDSTLGAMCYVDLHHIICRPPFQYKLESPVEVDFEKQGAAYTAFPTCPPKATLPFPLLSPIPARGWQRKKSREKITKITKGQKVQGKISQWAKKIKIKINWGYPKKTCPWSSFT